MSQLANHTQVFARSTATALSAILGTGGRLDSEVVETRCPSGERDFSVCVYFTGMVYGEYILSMDETTALAVLGMPADAAGDAAARADLRDAFAEVLNTSVGEAITELHETYRKLTFTAPRACFGTLRHPDIASAMCLLHTDAGDIECRFYLDAMRLDLATSYEEVVKALVDSNRTLETANKQLREQQAQLVHAEKMASLGVLAAGVAHEVNNPLAFVASNFATLEGYLDTLVTLFSVYESLAASLGTSADEAVRDHLERIGEVSGEEDLRFIVEDTGALIADSRDGLDRIKRIIRSLREFSHVDAEGDGATDLNHVIENTLVLVNSQVKDRCEVRRRLADIPPVQGNGGEFGQVFANLVVNAAQAMPGGGCITVETRVEGDEVVARVSDTGEGIAPENLSRIFNPFFTTKPVGKGTGLGLSISHTIVQKHGGRLLVESTPGKGTTFTVRLRAAGPPVAKVS